MSKPVDHRPSSSPWHRIGHEVAVPPALTLLLALLVWSFEGLKQPIDSSYLATQVLEYGVRSSRYQFGSYAAVLIVLVATVVVGLALRAVIVPVPWRPQTSRQALGLAMALWVSLFVLGDYTPSFAAGFAVGLAMFWWARAFPERVPGVARLGARLLVLAGLAYLVVFVVAPVFTPVPVRSSFHLVELNSHYSMTVMPGFDLTCCTTEGSIQRANYGVSMTLLAALPFKLAPGLLSTHAGGLVFIVRLYQVVAIALLCCAIYQLNRKHFAWLAAIALLITPTLGTLGEALWYPNQAGIRYIPFLIGLVVLIRFLNAGRASIIVLGLSAAVLTVLSPECGIVLAAGYGTYAALMRSDGKTPPLVSILKTLALFFAVFVPSFALLLLGSIKLLYADSGVSAFELFRLYSGGYGGLVTKLSVFAALLFLIGGHAVLRGAVLATRREVTPLAAYQAAIGAMMLVWLPYYMNRMTEWNLWFQTVLIIVMFAPSIPQLVADALRSQSSVDTFRAATLIALIAAFGVSSASVLVSDAWGYVRLAREKCLGELSPTQGFCMKNPTLADAPTAMLRELDKLESKDDYLVLSHLSASVRLLGFNDAFPWYEPFGELYRSADLSAMITWIDAHGPRHLLVESPSTELSRVVPLRARHLHAVAASLTSYRQVSVGEHWHHYERN